MTEQEPQSPDPDDPMPSFKVFCLSTPDGLSDPQASGWDGPGWYFWEWFEPGELAGPFGTREEAQECMDRWFAGVQRGEGF